MNDGTVALYSLAGNCGLPHLPNVRHMGLVVVALYCCVWPIFLSLGLGAIVEEKGMAVSRLYLEPIHMNTSNLFLPILQMGSGLY